MNNKNIYIILIWIVSLTAMLGSLYYSEIVQFFPCTLCWYQRILMYPLVLIILVGVLSKDEKVYLYTLAMSTLGGLISIYHYALQWGLFSGDECSGVACSTRYVEYLGFITIPFLALTAFLLIFLGSLKVFLMNQTSSKH